MPTGVYKRKPFTKEHKEKIGKANKISQIGNKNGFKCGNKLSVGNKNHLGTKLSEETRKKMSISHGTEENNRNWKGDDVSYTGLHIWVKKKLGKASCCKNQNCKSKNPKIFDWASISHKAKRDINDYISLCRSCHKKYDCNKLTLKQLCQK